MDTNNASAKPPSKEPLDPSRRVWDKNVAFVPIEKRMVDGKTMTFQTSDKERYYRTSNGVIYRKEPKVNGKEAKKARQKARQGRTS